MVLGQPFQSILHQSRSQHFGFALNGKGYIGLGFDGVSNSPNEFWEYDPVDDNWTELGSFPAKPRTGAVSFVIGQNAYVGMGWVRHEGLVSDFWEYNPDSDAWKQVSDCPYKSLYGCTFSIADKGYFGTGLFSNGYKLWEYSPEPTGIDDLHKQNSLVVYPNPSSDFFIINCESQACDFIKIYSRSGALIHTYNTFNNKLTIKDLASGIYHVQARISNRTIVRTIVKL